MNLWHVILNPAAGNGRAGKQWTRISGLLREAGIEFDYSTTAARGDATNIACKIIEQGCRRIIGVGGDGTNNEILNGIMQSNAPAGDVTYGVIPFGTGNDWIRTHKIPKNTRKAIQLIKAGKTTLQDVGLANYTSLEGQEKERYFMNVAGMSYDAICTKASEDRGIFASNKIMYLYLLISCLRGFVAPRGRVFFDKKTDEDNYYLVNVGVCRYSGGGMQLVPHSIPNDGQFALTLARNLSKSEVIRVIPALYSGTAGKHPKVNLHYAKSVRVEAADNEPILLEVDGEFLGGTPVEFTLLEKALRVVVG